MIFSFDENLGLIFFFLGMIVVLVGSDCFLCDYGRLFMRWFCGLMVVFVFCDCFLCAIVVLVGYDCFFLCDCGLNRGPYILFLNAPSSS